MAGKENNRNLQDGDTLTECKTNGWFLLLFFPPKKQGKISRVKRINTVLSLATHTHAHIYALYGIHKHRQRVTNQNIHYWLLRG
ncbi:hypothetical protein GHT06_008104 [Daphnia sinensis]|uniref:Uncharacterized protein n=1 Tax=Daphnia sinensis TaxID=1820382 RepID=A0AAD5LLP5_9CRUS|nr:hypothetical protein GHT06_008104 [Daphnia sinensis]